MEQLKSSRYLHALFESQVPAREYQVALTAGMVQLTYGEVEQRGNQVGRHLRSLGAGPEQVVAVIAHRQADTVVALLGVLKSGAAYLPIDPALPADRIAFQLDDAGALAVVGPVPNGFPTGGRPVVPMDSAAPWRALGGERMEPVNTQHDIAYVIYTSGSTGRPKGVMVEHRQIVNSTIARVAFGRRTPEVAVLVVPMSFDAAAQPIYWTFASGGRLVVAHDRQVTDPRSLADLIRMEKVTHLNCVPSLYGMLLEVGASSLTSLRDVSVGGEVAPPALVRRHLESLPDAELYNDYGPTETAVWASAHRCGADTPDPVPIGRPVLDTSVHLLDDELREVEPGSVGHIAIGGTNVTRGYVGSPSITARSFVPDPFSVQPGARLYLTGDYGRRAQGPGTELEFVGRMDDQIKLRGHRIDLGEIDVALRRLDAVADAATVAVASRSGDPEIVAFVVPSSDGDLDARAIRSGLASWLPAAMIPSRIELVAIGLPRTRHGKIDRAQLAGLASGGRGEGHGLR